MKSSNAHLPLRIVVDTREKEPWSFDCAVTRKKLPAGDYSLESHENRVAIERKSLDDFVSTLIHGKKRFQAELSRLSTYRFACIVVEADLSDIVCGQYRSDAHPNAVLGLSLAIWFRYGIPVFFCSNRQVACRFAQDFLKYYGRRVAS